MNTTILSPPRLHRHTLDAAVLEALTCGQGDAPAVAALKSGEISVRLALLWELASAMSSQRDEESPLFDFKEMWSLLDRAWRQSPDTTREMLLHPYVGIATLCTIRRIQNITFSDNPLWTDIAYFHALTAIAAINAGIDFRLTLASRDGMVVLPTVGHAIFAHSVGWGTAEIYHDGGRLRLSSGTIELDLTGLTHAALDIDGARWRPAHHLHLIGDGESLNVILEDLDQFRSLRGATRPEPLDADAVARWRRCLEDAWALLLQSHPTRASVIAAGLVAITPAPPGQPFRPLSASSDFAFGTALVSEPEDAVQLAVGLVHEFQHNKLGALMHQVEMYRDVPGELVYAPWRDDPRPLRGVVQGVYAFVAVTEFWHELCGRPDSALARFEFALWRRQTLRTLDALRDRPELTDDGRDLIANLRSATAALAVCTPPGEWERDAELHAEDHYARWKAHHRVPDPLVVEELADAWTRGDVRPAVGSVHSALRDDTAGRWLDSRAVLYRMWLTRRADFDRLSWTDGDTCEAIGGARYADALLVVGDVEAAESHYLAALTADPVDAWAWTGLRLVRAGRSVAGGLLHEQPDLVLAIQRELLNRGRPAAPLDLVSWCENHEVSARP